MTLDKLVLTAAIHITLVRPRWPLIGARVDRSAGLIFGDLAVFREPVHGGRGLPERLLRNLLQPMTSTQMDDARRISHVLKIIRGRLPASRTPGEARARMPPPKLSASRGTRATYPSLLGGTGRVRGGPLQKTSKAYLTSKLCRLCALPPLNVAHSVAYAV